MRLVTKDTDYAMRALVYVAERNGEVVAAKDISARLDISHSYLRKLLQRLAGVGVLVSSKGKKGGFVLNKKPEEITLAGLVRVFQGDVGIALCTVRSNPCPNAPGCLLHRRLVEMEAFFEKKVGAINLRSLLEVGAYGKRASRRKL
jgi:Rrf2 family protein